MLHIFHSADRFTVRDDLFYRAVLSANKKRKSYIMVPDQFSFESEKRLYEIQHTTESKGEVEVLTFRSLAEKVFTAIHRKQKTYLSAGGQILLMGLALDQCAAEMTAFSGLSNYGQAVGQMLETITQFKHAMIPLEKNPEQIRSIENQGLRHKVEDIALLTKAYDALAQTSFEDPSHMLAQLAKTLRETPLFEDACFFFDSFDYFTSLQLEVVGALLSQCADLSVAFCAQEVEEEGVLAFTVIQRCCKALYEMADRLGVEAKSPLYLPANLPEDLEVLKCGTFYPDARQYDREPERIHIRSTEDTFEEAEMIASTIQNLVFEKGYRYRDIGVIVRDNGMYRIPFRRAMLSMGVPYFMDETIPADQTLLFRFCISALTCCAGGFATEDVLNYVKTGLAGLDEMETCLLENYVYVWDIKYGQWLKPFSSNPAGLLMPTTKETEKELEQLESLRKKTVEPLLMMQEELKTGKYAQGLYAFVERAQLENQIDGIYSAEEKRALGKEYDALMDALSQLHMILQNGVKDMGTFLRMFRNLCGTIQIGSIPEILDRVSIGTADRMRSSTCKVLFVAGLNEGVFPSKGEGGGILTPRDKQQLSRYGIVLQGTEDDMDAKEYYYLYSAFSMARGEVFLSYHRLNAAREETYPSVAIALLQRVFPCLKETVYVPKTPDLIWNEKSALAQFGHLLHKDPQRQAVLDAMKEESRKTAQKITKDADEQTFSVKNEGAMCALTGNTMHLSPSKIDKFYRCRFQYFCDYVLRLKEIKKAELSPMESGTVIHYALEQFIALGAEAFLGMDEEEISESLDGFLRDFVQEQMQEVKDDPVVLHLLQRMKSLLLRFALRLQEEFSMGSFLPTDVELPIVQGGKVEPLIYSLPDGGRVLVEGKIDRVDQMKTSDAVYVRVVDYKTGLKELKLSDVGAGLNIQMLLYLFCIWKNGKDEYSHTLPGGVLYQQVQDAAVQVNRDTPKAEVERKKKKNMKVTGLILSQKDVIEGMEPEGAEGYIPSFEKNKSSFATLEEMEEIKKYLDTVVVHMAQQLRAGNVAPAPVVDSGDHSPCSYCPYQMVCGLQKDKATTTVGSVKREEFYQMIGEVNKSGEETVDSTTVTGD